HVGALWGQNDPGAIASRGQALAEDGVIDEAGPYVATFRLSTAGSSVRVRSAAGDEVEIPYPPSARSDLLAGPLELLLHRNSAGETYRIHRVEVSTVPNDADGDGVCDGRDQCAGDDGTVDADGDGYTSGCDCNDGDASVHPGAAELCDGHDQDCDGHADQSLIADGRGVELIHQVAREE